jgi:hypothetical protein
MNISCDIISDLLPLSYEGVCNESSKKLVEAHLAECAKCRASLEEMKDNKFDEHIKKERENVLGNHIQNLKKQSVLQWLEVAILITIIPTFIINLATSGKLDWFFIVLTGAMLFGSLTMTPLLVTKNRGTWTLITATTSLLLLLYVIESYVSGPYSGRWFGMAAVSILATIGVSCLVIKIFGKK